MPDDQLREARFDHVNERGDLVFEAMSRHFTVRVTDALERGILEARQVRAELEGTPQPQAAAALPISQIQSLIRSGSSVQQVAGQFNVSEALVRRFAAPVETEKKYAIDQFLSMGAGRAARGQQSNADIIAEALQTSRIGMDALTWKATRRGHEPWRIEATFESSNRTLRADWSWNMRDNTVVSLNSIAKRLLGETVTPVPGLMDDRTGAGSGATGKAMDGRPVSFWTDAATATVTPEPATAAGAYAGNAGTAGATGTAGTDRNGTDAYAYAQTASAAGTGAQSAADASGATAIGSDAGTASAGPAETGSVNATAGADTVRDGTARNTTVQNGTVRNGVASGDSAQSGGATGNGTVSVTPSNDAPNAGTANAATPANAAASSPRKAGGSAGNPMTAWLYGGSRKAKDERTSEPGTSGAGAGSADRAASATAQPQIGDKGDSGTQQPKRKSTRSAVPSWDEILFGE